MKPAHKQSLSTSTKVISLLNQGLADALALKLSLKQAHWNVKGENFIALHELFDKVATDVDGYADEIAERAVQLGGTAQGTAADIADRAEVAQYPVRGSEASAHVKATAQLLRALAEQLREDIDTSAELGDAVTADILTGITGGLDKWRWMVESHAK
jgi:starvation-inducible DNA-binding protein